MILVSTLVYLLLLGYASMARASDIPHVMSESAVRQHLLQHNEPTYPPIAKAARIQGNVEVSLVINITGHVAVEKIIDGPPVLRQSAFDAVKEWRFTPFRINGVVTPVSTILIIPFHLDKHVNGPTIEQEKAAQAWFPLADRCRNLLKMRSIGDSLKSCKQSLDMSLKAGDLTSSDQLAMLESYQEYGHALLAGGRLREALTEEGKAIAIAKAHLKETDQEYAMPFYWRAMVEEGLGQGDAASTDLSIAEETHRRAITHLPEMKKVYSLYLAAILRQHAALLDRMGKPVDAAKLRAEAASL